MPNKGVVESPAARSVSNESMDVLLAIQRGLCLLGQRGRYLIFLQRYEQNVIIPNYLTFFNIYWDFMGKWGKSVGNRG